MISRPKCAKGKKEVSRYGETVSGYFFFGLLMTHGRMPYQNTVMYIGK